MSDLFVVAPTIQIGLFIVAPKERLNKVKAEISHPTFEKIGLRKHCKFISTEELDALISKVSDLGGHVHPTIIEAKAVEL